MTDALRCPSCGGPLDYDEHSESDTVRCPFCESTVELPERERHAARQPVAVERTPTKDNTAVIAGVICVIVSVFVTGGIALIAFVGMSTLDAKHSDGVSNTKKSLSSKDAGDDDAHAELIYESSADGPVSFKDALYVTADAGGHIYVGEESGSHVDVFDSSGKFLKRWPDKPELILTGLAADRRGNVYVAQGGAITRYDGLTGKVLGTLGGGHTSFDDVTATADGGFVASSSNNEDDIFRLNSSGKITKTIKSAISAHADKSERSVYVACDGLGQIYALGGHNHLVFKFSADGQFLTQFGGEGDSAGHFNTALAIAADQQGRVYVGDTNGVQVFDPNGGFLRRIKVSDGASGIALNDRNELFIVSGTQVYKFSIDKP